MQRGDIVTIGAGIVIVIVIASAAQFSGIFRPSSETPTMPLEVMTTAVSPAPLPVPTSDVPVQPTPAPAVSKAPANPDPYRIFYNSDPFSYPVFKLPENMGAFGAGDIPWKDADVVPFAYIEEPRGGITNKFSIPYGQWRTNISVGAWTKPQYARFAMVVCKASDGTVIDGIEILYPGSAYRNFRISNTDLYIIISEQDVDRFRITFETPRSYYDQTAVP